MIKPIKILTQNMLDDGTIFNYNGGSSTLVQGAENAAQDWLEIVFSESRVIDTILISETNINNIEDIQIISAEGSAYISLQDYTSEQSGHNILISFAEAVSLFSIKIIFAQEEPEGVSATFRGLIFAKSLVNLDKTLSSLSASNYKRGGHYYTADGSLVIWRDFTKNCGSLTLENVEHDLKNELEYMVNENTFFTFIFYGAYDLSQSGEYAITEPFKAELNRSRGLWTVYLEITEK